MKCAVSLQVNIDNYQPQTKDISKLIITSMINNFYHVLRIFTFALLYTNLNNLCQYFYKNKLAITLIRSESLLRPCVSMKYKTINLVTRLYVENTNIKMFSQDPYK